MLSLKSKQIQSNNVQEIIIVLEHILKMLLVIFENQAKGNFHYHRKGNVMFDDLFFLSKNTRVSA